jgi:uncharacterized protein
VERPALSPVHRIPRLALIATGVAAAATLGAWAAASRIYAHRLLHPVRFPTGPTPATFGLDYHDDGFRTSDRLMLRGWWIPSRGRATIILLHGVGGSRGAFLTKCAFLNRAGFDLLVYDQRGTGASEGRQITVGAREAEDVSTAIDHVLRTRGHRPVVLFGHSLGAATAVMAAAQDERVSAVIDDSGFASVEDLIDTTGRRYTGPIPPAWIAAPVVTMLRWQHGVDLRAIRPIDAVRRMTTPLLVLSGARDPIVPLAHQRQVAAEAGGPTEHVVFETAGHDDAHTMEPERYEAAVLSFLERYSLGST